MHVSETAYACHTIAEMRRYSLTGGVLSSQEIMTKNVYAEDYKTARMQRIRLKRKKMDTRIAKTNQFLYKNERA